MGRTEKKRKQTQREQRHERVRVDPPNQKILDSIGNPNVWTPKKEDAWLHELRNLSAEEIYRRFPPMRKPPNVRKRGKGSGWGDYSQQGA